MDIIRFVHPEWLPLVALSVAVVVTVSGVWLRRRTYIVNFYGRGRGRVYSRFRVFSFNAVLALISLVLGLLVCAPFMVLQEKHDLFGPVDIVLAVDISKSMLARADASLLSEDQLVQEGMGFPSRLAVAVREINDLIDTVAKKKQDRLGLVVFARYAYPAIPVLSRDYQLFRRRFEKEMLLENVLTMPEGSNHWYAVERALHVFGQEQEGKKVLVLLTDGEPYAPEDTLVKSRSEALTFLKQMEDVSIYLVGIGDPAIRLPVAKYWKDGWPDEDQGYMVQTTGPDKGKIMTTRTDELELRALAEQLGAVYVHATGGKDLAEMLKKIIDSKRSRIGSRFSTSTVDLSAPLLGLLLSLLVLLVFLKTP